MDRAGCRRGRKGDRGSRRNDSANPSCDYSDAGFAHRVSRCESQGIHIRTNGVRTTKRIRELTSFHTYIPFPLLSLLLFFISFLYFHSLTMSPTDSSYRFISHYSFFRDSRDLSFPHLKRIARGNISTRRTRILKWKSKSGLFYEPLHCFSC